MRIDSDVWGGRCAVEGEGGGTGILITAVTAVIHVVRHPRIENKQGEMMRGKFWETYIFMVKPMSFMVTVDSREARSI